MAVAAEAKTTGETVAKLADVKKLASETAQANAAYARMVVDESASRTRATTEKGMEQMNRAADGFLKAAEEAAAFGRGNVEALAKATQAYVSGVQDLSRQTVAMVQGLTDQALEGAKALAGAKSLKEAAEIQALFARSAFDRTTSETAKLQQAVLQVAERAFAPLTQRATAAVAQAAAARPLAA